MRKHELSFNGVVALGLAVVGLGWSSPVRAQDVEDDSEAAKAIYVQSESGKSEKPGVKFNVVLKGEGADKRVSTTHTFKPGDKMLFEFQVSKPSYVYVINRTMKGDGERYAGKAISVVKDEDKKEPAKRKPARTAARKESCRLLFPSQSAGTDNKIAPGKPVTVPNGASFVMDTEPGVEKLYVIASATPIDVKKYFDSSTGTLRTPAATAAKAMGEGDDLEGDDALDLLNKDLEDWADNAEVAMAKGTDSQDFAIGKAAAKPMMVEVSLSKKAK